MCRILRSGNLLFMVGILVFMNLGLVSYSVAEVCNAVEATICVGSANCMYKKIGDRFEYSCAPPADQCKIGFIQANKQGKAQCESRAACKYVPAEKCYCPPDVTCICGGGAPPACEIDTSRMPDPPTGRFVIVDIRKASDVAAPLDLTDRNEPIGKEIVLTNHSLSTTGMGCDDWSIKNIETNIGFHDPNLSDVMIAPVDTKNSEGDSRILTSWSYSCEGEHFMSLTQIDDRVLVIPWRNSAEYLIAEKPMTMAQITRLQKQLKSMKFYDGPVTGKMDDATITSLGFWAHYRAGDVNGNRFFRPAVTKNLMDGLGVF